MLLYELEQLCLRPSLSDTFHWPLFQLLTGAPVSDGFLCCRSFLSWCVLSILTPKSGYFHVLPGWGPKKLGVKSRDLPSGGCDTSLFLTCDSLRFLFRFSHPSKVS